MFCSRCGAEIMYLEDDLQYWCLACDRPAGYYDSQIQGEPVKFGLCRGRHEIPGVENYIFPGEVNPLDTKGLELDAVLALEAAGDLSDGIDLYVTGLTVALIAVVNAAITHGIALTLFHFDRATGNYYPQELRSWN